MDKKLSVALRQELKRLSKETRLVQSMISHLRGSRRVKKTKRSKRRKVARPE